MQIRLDYLIAVAEEQNVTRAAKRLFISQPALTKYINQVEEYFGVRIFDRSRNPVTLTDAGNYLLREQGKIETEQMTLRRRPEMMGSNRERITIGTGFGRGEAWVPKILQDFCPRHPEVDVRLHCCGELELMDLLTSGKVDLAIGTCDFSSELVVSQALLSEKLRLAIPLSFGVFPEGFDAEESIDSPYLLQPEQLNGLPYIAPDEHMGSFTSYQTLLHQHGVRFGRLISSNSSAAIRGMVKAGLGYTYLSVSDLRIWLDRDGRPLVGFATIAGLSMQRSCNYGYLPGHPKIGYLEELSRILVAVVKGSGN